MMAAIQAVRRKAHETGDLVSNEFIEVIVEGEVIRITPAEINTIPVPRYKARYTHVTYVGVYVGNFYYGGREPKSGPAGFDRRTTASPKKRPTLRKSVSSSP